jgi:hypothetical protein
MQDITIRGRELSIEFGHASQGHRLTVMEYDGDEWQTLPEYDYVLCLGATYFDSLCNLASDLFDDASVGETLAEELGVPLISYDDEDLEEN